MLEFLITMGSVALGLLILLFLIRVFWMLAIGLYFAVLFVWAAINLYRMDRQRERKRRHG